MYVLRVYLVLNRKWLSYLILLLENLYQEILATLEKLLKNLRKKKVDFDFDGEMQPDVALNPIYREIYPFSKIVGNANILIASLNSAAISTKLMKVFGGGKNIGPLLIWLGQPIEVAPLRASTSEILNLASIAAYSSEVIDYSN